MKNKKILLADYVLDFLREKNVKHVPLLIGGAISFMVDSFSNILLFKLMDNLLLV